MCMVWLSTGTAVTVESFLKWKKQFDEEMLAKEVILRKSGVAVSNTAMLPLSAITIGSSGSISSSTGLSASEISSLLGDERPTGKQIFLMQLSVGNGSLGISGTDEEALLLEAEKEDYSDEFFNAKGDGVGGVDNDDDDDDDDYEPSVGSNDLDDDDDDDDNLVNDGVR
jgi:hypothetical protein